MGKINFGRVVLGGIVAGLIINAIETGMNMTALGEEWAAWMAAHNMAEPGPSTMVFYMAFGFIIGIVAVWTYAAIRPRFGAGPKTAVYAALLTWMTAYVLSMLPPTMMGMFTPRLFALAVCVGFVEMIVATVIGAWLYKEPEAA